MSSYSDTEESSVSIETFLQSPYIPSPYTIKTYRGIKCASTIPKELIWGKPNTALECANCIAYASYKNVLVGLCGNCAPTYDNKYGSGFHCIMEETENKTIFGNIYIDDIDFASLPNNEYEQVAINSYEAYTVYNLAKCAITDLDLLFSPNIIPEAENYGWKEFIKIYSSPNYNDDKYEILNMLLRKIDELQNQFDQWSPEFLERCLKIEKFFKRNEANNISSYINTDSDILQQRQQTQQTQDISLEIKYKCCYCNEYKIRKDLKKCSRCKAVKYCSLLCQKRHWRAEIDGHRRNCISTTDDIANTDAITNTDANTLTNLFENIEFEDAE